MTVVFWWNRSGGFEIIDATDSHCYFCSMAIGIANSNIVVSSIYCVCERSAYAKQDNIQKILIVRERERRGYEII